MTICPRKPVKTTNSENIHANDSYMCRFFQDGVLLSFDKKQKLHKKKLCANSGQQNIHIDDRGIKVSCET